VDVTIPVDPSVPEGLNSTNTMRLQTTFDVFGTLCEPVSETTQNAVQLLLHGFTYNSQYWDVTWGGLQNYSYVDFSCRRGISSFAYDDLAAGQTIKQNSTHVQLPTVASVSSSLARDLKSGRISQLLFGSEKKYEKVVGIGHSLGSITLDQGAISDGAHSPFDGLILTGSIHPPSYQNNVSAPPAREVNPGRWGDLDPGYVTTPNISERSKFYGPDNGTSFSPTVLQLDELTKDVGSTWSVLQLKSTFVPAFGFRGPVAEIVGSEDQAFCLPSGGPCDQAKLQVSEAAFYPDSKNFTMIVIDGFGHDLNYQFGAAEVYPIMTSLFESFIN